MMAVVLTATPNSKMNIEFTQREINLVILLTGIALRSKSKSPMDDISDRKEEIKKLQKEIKKY